MSPEYEKLFNAPPVRFRIVEKSTSALERFAKDNGLAAFKSVGCGPLNWCEPKRCFINAEEQVRQRGGTIETGWIFNELEDRVITSEAHAVWREWNGKRHDITPHQFQPVRVLFSPDTRVALKRGYTTPYKLILSSDPRVRAIEEFDLEISRMENDLFDGFGKEVVLDNDKLQQAAVRIGLPLDVAHYMVREKCRRSLELARQHRGAAKAKL